MTLKSLGKSLPEGTWFNDMLNIALNEKCDYTLRLLMIYCEKIGKLRLLHYLATANRCQPFLSNTATMTSPRPATVIAPR